jgi:hypothetical protein
MTQKPLSAQDIQRQLQQTIEQLQQLAVKLDNEPIEVISLPLMTGLQTLQSTTRELNEVLNTSFEEKVEVKQEEMKVKAETSESFDDFLDIPIEEASETPPPVIETQKGRLSPILSPIRAILPTGLNETLSDGIIGGIIGGIILAVLIGSFFLIYPQFSEPEVDIAENPPIIETPVELESPEPPQSIVIEPPPEPEISPEQRLIKAVQEDIADITSRYPEGLIDSIQANFIESRLTVILGQDWYQLRPTRQDDVAKGIFQKAKNLDFQKLELVNKQGDIIARSPVVGNQMIILLR